MPQFLPANIIIYGARVFWKNKIILLKYKKRLESLLLSIISCVLGYPEIGKLYFGFLNAKIPTPLIYISENTNIHVG